MVLNQCTVCTVYGAEDTAQKRVPVKCAGEQIILLLKLEHELSDSSKIRIDFFDGQIGCVKTNCELTVRRNYDSAIPAPWIADCSILEVIEIIEGRRSVRAKMEKEVTFTHSEQGDFRGVIQNISEGGLYFVTNTQLQCDDSVSFSHCFIEKEHQMEAVILREEVFRDGRFGYGCQFLALSRDAERDIKQYVYLRQQGRIW